MKKPIIHISSLCGALFLAGCFFNSCTSNYEKWNINPNEATPEQMQHDNLKTGAYFTQMEKGVFIVGKDKGGEYQITETMCGDMFASYMANISTFSYTAYHNDHYALYQGWYNAAFNDAYTDIMQPWLSITGEVDSSSPAWAIATIVKVLGMNRITDMYGPIPYTKFGTATHVSYDSQKDVYYKFFEELDTAIKTLTAYTSKSSSKYMEEYDYIYNGDMKKWLKFANTLRLRLAMRISYVDETKAKEEMQAAIDQEAGLMTSADDSAILHQTDNLTFINPIWEISENFEDVRMSATMDCYLNGYEDPRLSLYFRGAKDDGLYHGVRNGMERIDKDKYKTAASGINYQTTSNLPWMWASEAYFLMAEAKLRFGLGSETVQKYYEDGIRTSFTESGAPGVAAYLENNKLPLTSYADPVTKRGTNVQSSLSQVTVKWDDNASTDKKLERIMTQKWIALFPNGQEAWSEMRRTGYPGFVRIASYSHTSEVANNELISRLKFPTTEYSNNSQNTQAAVSLLGGQDIAGTRLWWDVKR